GFPYLSVRKVARRGEWTEEQVGDHCERGDAEQADRQVHSLRFVMETERARLPEQEVRGLAQIGGRCGACDRGDEREGDEQPCGGDERSAQGGGSPVERLVANVEGAAAGEEDRGDHEVA